MAFLEDAWNATGGRVVDVATDVFEATPVAGPLKDAVNGPLRDFANTPTGQTVLRAIATALYSEAAGALYWASVPFGAQLATVVWAFPGLMRGDDFDRAWLLEVKDRGQKTAEILGPGVLDAFGTQLSETLQRLGDEYGVGNLVDLTAKELSSRFSIREDVAALALSLWNKIPVPPLDKYDPITGKAPKFGRTTAYDAASVAAVDPCRAWARAVQDGKPAAIVQLLKEKCIAGHGATTLDVARQRGFSIEGRYAALDDDEDVPPIVVAASSPLSPESERRKQLGDVVLAAVVLAAGWAVLRAYQGKPLF